jgi:hypothetical protein
MRLLLSLYYVICPVLRGCSLLIAYFAIHSDATVVVHDREALSKISHGFFQGGFRVPDCKERKRRRSPPPA